VLIITVCHKLQNALANEYGETGGGGGRGSLPLGAFQFVREVGANMDGGHWHFLCFPLAAHF
jgi:hypothetical protein